MLAVIAVLALGGIPACAESGENDGNRIELPAPRPAVDVPLHRVLQQRRSVRRYSSAPLSLAEVAQLLWAAQGVSDEASGFRTSPSAGATFPLELYLAVGNVQGLEPGLYRYLPREHALHQVGRRDLRQGLYNAGLRQQPLRDAPAVLAITAVHERTARRYGARAERYVAMEAGHASQNIYLQATALQLGTVAIGAFHDAEVAAVLQLGGGEAPLYLMPVGRL